MIAVALAESYRILALTQRPVAWFLSLSELAEIPVTGSEKTILAEALRDTRLAPGPGLRVSTRGRTWSTMVTYALTVSPKSPFSSKASASQR
jgi:hypothetical protein